MLSVFSNVLAGDTGRPGRIWPTRCSGEFVFNTVVLFGVGLGVVDRRDLGLADDDAGLSRAALPGVGAGAAAGDAGLCDGLRLGFSPVRRPGAGLAARDLRMGRGDYWFPGVRTVGGAVAMFMFVLYPYVSCRAHRLPGDAGGMLEAGRTLGLGPGGSFFRLPAAGAPAVVAGTALALMETLADFGTVSRFGRADLHHRHLSRLVLARRPHRRRAAVGALLAFVVWC